MNSETSALFIVVNKNFDEAAAFDLTHSEATAFVERRGVSDYDAVRQTDLTDRWAFGSDEGEDMLVGCGDIKSARAYARILARRSGEKAPVDFRQLTVRDDYARNTRLDDIALAFAVSTDRLRRASGMK